MYDGKVCSYCSQPTEYVDSAKVYGRTFGMIYHCISCEAWVGVHKGTNKALGRLANKALRKWKQEAHKYFDPLWRKKMQQGFSKTKARHKAYKWLAKQMGLPVKETHIGMFDVDQCKQVVEICKRLYHEPPPIYHRHS
jgi:Fe-S cluster biosynthesis and repair protein YggX